VPLNDPFGGWVQWARISPIEVESVEVLRGGASNLYGDNSLSRSDNVMPRKVEDKYAFSADVFGGTQNTLGGFWLLRLKSGGWAADGIASSFQTQGFKPVDEAVRGLVDAFAGVRSSNFSARYFEILINALLYFSSRHILAKFALMAPDCRPIGRTFASLYSAATFAAAGSMI